MVDSKVSLRYATSLLDMAEDKKNLEDVSNDMEIVKDAIESSDDFQNLLESPVVKPKVKSSILSEIFKTRINDESLKFLIFVVDKNRENFLFDIVKKFLELRNEKLGIVNVDVKTAFEFSDDQKNQLKTKLEKLLNKEINFKFNIDKNIVGGFIAKAGDTVYDASVSHQLDLLKKQFLKGGVPLN